MDQNRNSISKVKTNIIGLDEILNGGFPKGSLTLLNGGPGTGKTMLGLEFLVQGAQEGSPGILLTFEERERDLKNYARSFGWDIDALESSGTLIFISARIHSDAVLAGDFDLRGILGILRQKASSMNAERILIDAPDVFLRLLNDPAKERAELHALYEWLRDTDITALMTVKAESSGVFSSHYDFLDYMADCVVYLDQRIYEQVSTRRMRVVKYRGSAYGRNEYPFGITGNGLWIIPVTQANLQHRALGECLPTGIKGLDKIIGGGYRRYSCTLITGSSGTGKTTFVCSFVRSATENNERVLYIDFEESWDALASCMKGPGIDLMPAYESGAFQLISRMPEAQGIEEHLVEAFRAIQIHKPDHLILDAISACRRMGSQHSAFDYLLRLINYCKQIGITTLMTNLTAHADASQEITGIDLSSIIDSVIILRNSEIDGAYKRQLTVLKSRGQWHSNRVHDFTITGQGIDIAGVQS